MLPATTSKPRINSKISISNRDIETAITRSSYLSFAPVEAAKTIGPLEIISP